MEDADGQEVVAEVTSEMTSEVPQEQPLASLVVAVAAAQPAQIDHLFVCYVGTNLPVPDTCGV